MQYVSTTFRCYIKQTKRMVDSGIFSFKSFEDSKCVRVINLPYGIQAIIA